MNNQDETERIMIDDCVIQSIQSRLENNWQKVLFRLWIAKIRNEIFFLATGVTTSIIRGGWLPIWAFTDKMIGGSEGGRRKRNLTEKGFPFKTSIINGHVVYYKIHEWDLFGKKKKTPIYCLDCDLTPEDWEEILEKNAKYYYHHRPEPNIIPKSEIIITTDKRGQLCFI